MVDLIDRQRAIEIMSKMVKQKKECNCRHGSYEAQALEYAIAVIKQLPSVTDGLQEPRT